MPRRRPHRNHGQEACDRGTEAGSPFVFAGNAKDAGGDPVLQRRLLEVRKAIEAWRDPVTAREHFARNLGVTALVGEVQATQLEKPEPEHEKQQQRQRARESQSRRVHAH